MKVAQYEYVATNVVCIFPESFERNGALERAVRISEYVDIDFVPRAQADVDQEKRAAIEAKRAALKKEIDALERSELADLGV